MIKGRVLKVLSDRFSVDTGDSAVFVKARKKIKREFSPLPGDNVELEYASGEYVLSRICERSNRIIRPPVANLDCMVITLAPVPETDFATVDKMLINARSIGVETVICVNKTDIMPQGFLSEVSAQYGGVADEVISVCAAKGEIHSLTRVLDGKFTCLAGQSAVGKTSIINAVCGLNREVGNLSEKTLRGKNTTTGVELIKIAKETFIADTPGFGALDLFDIEASDLPLHYDEYVELAGKCKYHMCTHISEPDCAVKNAVERGELNAERYRRYCRLMEECKAKSKYKRTWRTPYENK